MSTSAAVVVFLFIAAIGYKLERHEKQIAELRNEIGQLDKLAKKLTVELVNRSLNTAS